MLPLNDIVLIAILAIGGILINWNIIKRDIFQQKEKNPEPTVSKKLHIKAGKRLKKKVS